MHEQLSNALANLDSIEARLLGVAQGLFSTNHLRAQQLKELASQIKYNVNEIRKAEERRI